MDPANTRKIARSTKFVDLAAPVAMQALTTTTDKVCTTSRTTAAYLLTLQRAVF